MFLDAYQDTILKEYKSGVLWYSEEEYQKVSYSIMSITAIFF